MYFTLNKVIFLITILILTIYLMSPFPNILIYKNDECCSCINM